MTASSYSRHRRHVARARDSAVTTWFRHQLPHRHWWLQRSNVRRTFQLYRPLQTSSLVLEFLSPKVPVAKTRPVAKSCHHLSATAGHDAPPVAWIQCWIGATKSTSLQSLQVTPVAVVAVLNRTDSNASSRVLAQSAEVLDPDNGRIAAVLCGDAIDDDAVGKRHVQPDLSWRLVRASWLRVVLA